MDSEKRRQLQRLIEDRLTRGDEVTVSWYLLRDALYDPVEQPVSTWDITMQEAILLAGGRSAKTQEQLFNQWCGENNIEQIPDHTRQQTVFRKTQRAVFAGFLGKVVAAVMTWPDVVSVEVGEDIQGHVRIDMRLTKNRRYGYIFTRRDLQLARDPAMLIDQLKHKFDMAMADATTAH